MYGIPYNKKNLLFCPLFREERKNYINDNFWKRPSTIKLEQLFRQNNNNVVKLVRECDYRKILGCS